MLAEFFSAFGLIFFAELPDKTALATLVLGARFRVRDVIAGAWLAFLIHTVISTAAGSLLHLLPERPIHVVAGLGFLLFAGLALRRDENKALREEEDEVNSGRRRLLPPVVVSFLVVFAAEWGDLTQLATAALVARSHNPIPPALGSLAALWAVALLAALAGAQMGRYLSPLVLNRVAAGVFALAGVIVLVGAIR